MQCICFATHGAITNVAAPMGVEFYLAQGGLGTDTGTGGGLGGGWFQNTIFIAWTTLVYTYMYTFLLCWRYMYTLTLYVPFISHMVFHYDKHGLMKIIHSMVMLHCGERKHSYVQELFWWIRQAVTSDHGLLLQGFEQWASVLEDPASNGEVGWVLMIVLLWPHTWNKCFDLLFLFMISF